MNTMNAKNDLPHASIDIDQRGIATVTIRQASPLNILGTPVISDLRRAFEQLSAQDQVRAVVLRGTGDKAFVAGADIKEMGWCLRPPASSSMACVACVSPSDSARRR